MKNLLPLSCALLASCGLLIGSASAAAAKKGKAATPKNGVSFDRTKANIDALLKQRLNPDPLPAVLPNPFQMTETTPPASADPGLATVAPVVAPLDLLTDDDRLLQYAAKLRISGLVRLNEITHLIINGTPHKEGDSITVGTKEDGPFLRIVRIAPGELTLSLNQAERILKFKM